MTTSTKVSDRNPRAPGGLRRRHTICVVAATQRCTSIAVGAAPSSWRDAAVTRAIRLLPRAAGPWQFGHASVFPMIPISAIIISWNEADRIGETISSLFFCDEILVIDAHSTDRTPQIAREAGARVLIREWKGYSDQKNYAATEAANDWVFSVDADERPSIELADEVRRWKESGPPNGIAGLSMPRRAFYLGRWIAHSGWYPDRKVRVYDRRAARWEGDFVHEGLRVEGPVQQLHGDLLHFPYRSLDDHHRRIDNYTRLAAVQAKKAGRHFNPLRLLLSPPLFFIKTFFLQRGFLDGRAGLKIASMGTRYAFLKEFRILR